jgi:hypothetical protein
MVVAGCAGDVASYSNVQPLYRAQGDFTGASNLSYYDMGKRYFAEKRYGLALDAFQSELRYNGKSINALNGIAACYDKLNRYDVAVSYYYKALRLDPESPRILSNLGYSFLLQGRDADAIKVLNLALKKDPDNAFIKQNLVLAKSHGWNIADNEVAAPDKTASVQGSGIAEKPRTTDSTTAAVTTPAGGAIATEVAAVEVKPASETPTRIAHHGEPPSTLPQANAVSPEMGTDVAVSETASVTEVATADSRLFPAIDISSQAAEPADVVAEPPQADMVAATTSTDMAVEETAIPSQATEASARTTRGVVTEEPRAATPVAVADNGLMPAIDISSEAAEPVEIVAAPPQADVVAAETSADVVVSEPAIVAEVAAADSGLFPAIDISSEATEPVEIVAAPPQADVVATETSTDVVVREPAIVTEVAAADSGLFPAIDISSQLEEPAEAASKSPRADMVSAETTTDVAVRATTGETDVAIADRGLIPASEIISQMESRDVQAMEQPHKASEVPVQKSPAIATIDVDKTLAKAHIVKVADSESSVTVQGGFEYTIEVSNGNGWNGMAQLLGKHLKSRGERVVRLTNAKAFNYTDTIIYYGSGMREQAEHLASQFPMKVQLAQTSQNRQDIDVRVVLGKDVVAHAPDVRSTLYAWEMNDAVNPVSATVEISNGNGRNGMARLLRSVMVSRGDSIRRVTNADNFAYQETVIYFAKGRREDAQQLAAKLPVKATLKETRENRSDIDLRVVLGKDFLNYEVAMRQFMDANA